MDKPKDKDELFGAQMEEEFPPIKMEDLKCLFNAGFTYNK